MVLIPSVYERKGRKKAEKINLTFSLSGWAMPFQRRGPRLWEVLNAVTAAPVPAAALPRLLPGKTFPEFLLLSPLSFPGIPALQVHGATVKLQGTGLI